MVQVMKRRAGSDSHGNVWESDGAVVDVDPEVAAELVMIPDGGFEVVSDAQLPDPPASHDNGVPGGAAVINIAGNEPGAGDGTEEPASEEPASEEPKPRRRR